jgi:hypothetical protein
MAVFKKQGVYRSTTTLMATASGSEPAQIGSWRRRYYGRSRSSSSGSSITPYE